jgi:hypothetical protein
LGLIALYVRIHLAFAWIFLLALMALVGFSRVVGRLRRERD